MLYHALVQYVHDARACGTPDDAIRENLRAAGWHAGDIADAFASWNAMGAPGSGRRMPAGSAVCNPDAIAAVPRPPWYERFVPHSYSTQAVGAVVIGFVLGYIAYVLFVR